MGTRPRPSLPRTQTQVVEFERKERALHAAFAHARLHRRVRHHDAHGATKRETRRSVRDFRVLASSRSDKNKKTSTPRIPTHERSIRSIGPIRSIRSIRRYSIPAVKSSRRNQLNQRFRLVTFALPLFFVFLAFYFSVRRGYHQLSVCTPQHAPGEGKYARGLGEFRILHNRTVGFPVRDCGHHHHTHVAVVIYRRV